MEPVSGEVEELPEHEHRNAGGNGDGESGRATRDEDMA